jgi:hypothetical protein
MDTLQGVTFALTGTVEPPTVPATLADLFSHYQLSVHVVADSEFLTILFDATHPKIGDSQTALQAGLWANFPTFSPLALERVMRQDYLWQADCFECFIAKDSQADSPYLEVNLATNGEFNLYYFDSYRTPNALPPRRLPTTALTYGKDINFFSQAITQDTELPLVFWHSASPMLLTHVRAVEQQYAFSACTFRVGMTFAKSALDKLVGANGSYALNPTRVIQQQLDSNVTDVSDSTITEMRYWAIQHANPADFHNKTYWINA